MRRLPSFVVTHDGNCLAFDPEVGVVSAPSAELARLEIERRKAAKRGKAA